MNSIRYQFVDNTLGTAFTTSNYPFSGDGDDKKQIVIKRSLAAADIGTADGQTRNALGAIVAVIPLTSNVLMIQGNVYRPQAAVSGVTPYVSLDGLVAPVGAPTAQENIQFALGLDNTIRVIDAGTSAGVQIASGDIVIVTVTIGTKVDPSDSLN